MQLGTQVNSVAVNNMTVVWCLCFYPKCRSSFSSKSSML